MLKKSKTLFLLSILSSINICLLTSCNIFDYHPYDVKIYGDTGLTAKNTAKIEDSLKGKKTFRFAMISDTQRWYDETEDAVESINARGDIDFVIHGGDQVDFGLTKEYLWMRDILKLFDMPWVTVLGNHDCIGTGNDCYKKIYGDYNYTFTAGNVRFIFLNTNALEFDYGTAVPDFSFLKKQLNNYPAEACRTIFVIHAPPFDVEFNNNVNYVFEDYLLKFPNPMFVLYGHVHQFKAGELFDDGLMYYACTKIKDRAYYVFTINENGYDYEIVNY
ncbi:MAG: metallophosphoesterase [Bacteroidales bacterium]|jgi:predicted phosphodiesterase|nr:metallophosphoesterase [Bacteroidales bacterium]